MRTKRLRLVVCTGVLPIAWLVAGCSKIIGLDQMRTDRAASTPGAPDPGASEADAGATDDGQGTFVGECATNAECTERATLAAASQRPDAEMTGVPAVCVKPAGRCVELLSEDCGYVTGDYLDDDAIVLGTLFSTKGAQAATNLQRQNSAALAIEEINAAGGIPAGAGRTRSRPLVMVSCDESTDLMRAATHLVDDLGVSAIVGPNTSQDTLAVSSKLTVRAGTVVITPTAVASGISDLLDDDLTWLMVPSDVQRAPLMIAQLNELEARIRTDRALEYVKLGVVFRNDALGIGTRTSLNALVWNGKPLSDPINLGNTVRIDAYDYKQADQSALVSAYRDFAPDIIVLAGTAEVVTNVMIPLEQESASETEDRSRPQYVLIDSLKVPELIAAVTGNDHLRKRVRGTGITPGPASSGVYNSFKIDYQLRYPGSNATISGMGPSYDAAYAIAFALAATKDEPVSGATVARGLRRLAGGPTSVEVGSQHVLAAFQRLARGEAIAAMGTFGPLDWDANGAVTGGTIEMWCIGATTATPSYQSSGLTFDVKTGKYSGQYVQCGP
jgi:ABC-type branched-subunit amino acid transport system substrate-binding protein